MFPIDTVATPAQIKTVIIDSIGADTASGRMPHYVNDAQIRIIRAEMRRDSLEHAKAISTVPDDAGSGVVPQTFFNPVTTTAVTGLMMCVLILVCLNAAGIGSALKRYGAALLTVRRRDNAFDDVHSASLPAAVMLAMVFVVFGGICLYFSRGVPVPVSFGGILAVTALLAVYYVFQLVAYSVVGYAFTTPDLRRQWLAGFNASQAYTGLLLIAPAMILTAQPQWWVPVEIFSLCAYLAGRIIFICKGFKIFYSKIRSLLYFILYLCTLEIIPSVAVYLLAGYLARSLYIIDALSF